MTALATNQMPPSTAFDIIGDLHGHADKLHELLAHMGYREIDGEWRHSERRALFVGDYIDRGPKQLATVNTVRSMVDGGSALALMGNHEFNAIAWATADPEAPGAHLRPRTGPIGAKNRKQHAAFLAEVEDQPAKHASVIAWFKTLPLWLELPGLRVVHACWHPAMMERLRPHLAPGERLTDALLVLASRKGTREYEALETLLKGEERPLPQGASFHDKDGHERHEVRTRWWHPNPATLADIALAPPASLAQLTGLPLPADLLRTTDDVPTFFGHYWMTGPLELQSPTMACVDYSVGKGGPLVAYRWSGESQLTPDNFVSTSTSTADDL